MAAHAWPVAFRPPALMRSAVASGLRPQLPLVAQPARATAHRTKRAFVIVASSDRVVVECGWPTAPS